MIPCPFDKITLADILALKDNEVPESKTLDYKLQLPTDDRDSKVKFLSTVAAFANSSGGDVVYGVEEEGGAPKAIPGMALADPDESIRRLNNLVRSGLEPVLTGQHIKSLKLEDGKAVIILRIPKSWNSPHFVTTGGHFKAYGRASAENFPMNVEELRRAFVEPREISEEIRRFRAKRVYDIHANESPLPLLDGGKLVMHVVPLSSFTDPQSNNLAEYVREGKSLPPWGATGWNDRQNLEGIISYSGPKDGDVRAYTLLFRNGIIEAVDVHQPYDGGKKVIGGQYFDSSFVDHVRGCVRRLKDAGINPPIYVFLGIAGAKDYCLSGRSMAHYIDGRRGMMDRDVALLPEIVIDNYEVDIPKTVRPLLDAFWNAFGFACSSSYDGDGEFDPR